MRRTIALGLSVALALAGAATARGEEDLVGLGPVRAYSLSDVEWKEGPFPGSKVAVLAGDPKTGMHHAYLELSDGARIAPHWHSTDEYATVVSGTVLFAVGEDFEPAKGRQFGPGAFIFVPARTPHYAWTEGGAVLSQTRSGAQDIHWVHAEDAPVPGPGALPPAKNK